MLDEHIAWNDHIHATKKKLPTNIDLLYTEQDSFLISSTKQSITVRGPTIWNEFLTKEKTTIPFDIPKKS